MPLPPFAVHLAESQLGVISRRQLRTGMSRAQADSLLRGPWFERIELGVHRVAGAHGCPSRAPSPPRSGPDAAPCSPGPWS